MADDKPLFRVDPQYLRDNMSVMLKPSLFTLENMLTPDQMAQVNQISENGKYPLTVKAVVTSASKQDYPDLIVTVGRRTL